MNNILKIKMIDEAAKRLEGVVRKTPLEYSQRLSKQYKAKIYIKREDLQEVRSYKIRGAYNKIASLSPEERKRGVVAASAGNHAQGVSYAAKKLRIHTTIFMPTTTPLQKIGKVKSFGDGYVTVKLVGHTYDEACSEALKFCKEKNAVFVHPFDDLEVIAGQGTVGKEIFESLENIDYLLAPIGGGGFISGTGTYLRSKLPKIKIVGAEPKGSPSMYQSLQEKKVVELESVETFVDGAAVKKPGKNTFEIVKKLVDKIVLIPEGQVCATMIDLYQHEGIVAEPAGALAISALENIKSQIIGKTVVCVLSGGNNDILRYPEIMERSLVFQGKKHYFLINFAQKPGQLRQFVDKALGPTDDIARFEYLKKSSKETGPALIGVELADKKDYKPLLARMKEIGISFTIIKHSDLLYNYLV